MSEEFVDNFMIMKSIYADKYNDNDLEGIVFKSTIKGYHEFRTRPLIGRDFVMRLCREPHNKYDHNAVLVKAPPLSDIPEKLHSHKTKETPPTQRVKDVAGHDVGRVPREIAGVVSGGLQKGWIKKGLVVHTGGFIHAGQGRGGGPQLKGMYLLVVKKERVEEITQDLKRNKVDVYRIKL